MLPHVAMIRSQHAWSYTKSYLIWLPKEIGSLVPFLFVLCFWSSPSFFIKRGNPWQVAILWAS